MRVSRKEYITKIWTYRERRKKYIDNYEGAIPVSKTMQYKNLTKRISQWTKEIKRLDVRNEKISNIEKAIRYYFDVDIKSYSTKKEVVLARKIYFKYGLEEGIRGTHLSRFIGRVSTETARHNRTTLTESFKTIPENKEAFYNFKKYLKNKNEDSKSKA